MELRPDGRKYSRILRRSVAIIKNLPKNTVLSIVEMAEKIHEKKLPEFYLERFGRQMSEGRMRDYIRYLREIKVIQAKDNKYFVSFQNRTGDKQWAQALSDLALPHLAEVVGKTPDALPKYLEKQRNSLLKARRVPTVNAIVASLGIEGGREAEVFKWSLEVYTDGEACPFDIRRHPVLFSSLQKEE